MNLRYFKAKIVIVDILSVDVKLLNEVSHDDRIAVKLCLAQAAKLFVFNL